MELNLPNLIRENVNLRQALRAQEGGIMKYWAEHPDADFDYKLYEDYEQQIVEAYQQAHQRNREIAVLSKDELKRKARDWYGFTEKELHYQAVLQPILPNEIKEQVNHYIEDYLVDADKDYLRCCYPDGIPPIDLYKGLIGSYRQGHMAFDCLMLMFKERYTQNEWEKSDRDRLNDFFSWRRSHATYENDGYKKLRQAVKEILDNKTDEECRKVAIDMMEKVKLFSHIINVDNVDVVLGEHKVTAADREWLRSVVSKYPFLILSNKKISHLHDGFATYVNLLMDIGRIWAARLLRYHHIDMHELEKETGVFLFNRWTSETEVDYDYYVDRYEDDLPIDCCVYDEEQAKDLLEKIKHGSNPPAELLTNDALPYWTKLREKGFVVADSYALMEGVSDNQAAYIAFRFSEKLGNKKIWKPFKELWGIQTLAQHAGNWKRTGDYPPRANEIDDIFGVKQEKPKGHVKLK